MRTLTVMLALSLAYGQTLTVRSFSPEYRQLMLRKNPLLKQSMARLESHTRRYEQSHLGSPFRTGQVITIPVVVHVIYRQPEESLSVARIQTMLDVMNEDFRRQNADASQTPAIFQPYAADVEIQFCLASRDPWGNPTTGITYTQTTLDSFPDIELMKFDSTGGKNAWPSDQYLNIWICDLQIDGIPGLGGYSTFPALADGRVDGIVIQYFLAGRGGDTLFPFTDSVYKGRVITHELGHWFNLLHIWGDAECGDDYVFDTPPQEGPNFQCPTFPKPSPACNNFISDMFTNYMDYTFGSCMNMFSFGQKLRMRATLAPGGPREGLLTSLGCYIPNWGCIGTQLLTSTYSYFTDGSGSYPYYDNSDCRWLIQPYDVNQIEFFIDSLDLQAGDSIIVYDGDNTSAPRLGAFSGNVPPTAPIVSSGPVMLVRFLTNNDYNTAAGFGAHYEGIRVPYCSGIDGNNPPPVFTTNSDTISDGSGPAPYRPGTGCLWFIAPSNGRPIQVEFLSLNTQPYLDQVRLFDIIGNQPVPIVDLSGDGIPPVVTSVRGEMVVFFSSDTDVEGDGWELRYTTVPGRFCQGTVTLTAPRDTIEDGSGESYYMNASTCRWLISPPGATQITLYFDTVLTYPGDYVRVYDGSIPSAPILATLEGINFAVPVLRSSGGSVLVEFVSDSFGYTGPGWRFRYESAIPSALSSAESHGVMRYYPTPCKDYLMVETVRAGKAEILNTAGQVIWRGVMQLGENRISTSEWSTGLYLLRVDGQVVGRFVRE